MPIGHDERRPSVPTAGLEWEQPEELGQWTSIQKVYVPILSQMRAHPKRWAKIAEYENLGSAYGASKRMKKMNAEHKFPGDFEFTVRSNKKLGKKGGRIYARFMSPHEEE
jgi:hypothetical protein